MREWLARRSSRRVSPVVAGEITTNTYVSIPDIVRGTISSIGYNDASFGFDGKTCAVLSTIDRQSPDIAQGVDTGGAGDQGMMFGYATDETPELMPMPIQLAHRLTQTLAERRKSGALPWLRPDGKAQVTVIYENGKPVRVGTVVVSTQHAETVSNEELHASIRSEVIERSIPPELLEPDVKYHINPTGRFVVGGPQGDAGLTGRKIIVDTYGGAARHGGGAFSGKDPSKVDRSAAYAARWVAKNIVAAGFAQALRGAARLRDRRGRAGEHHGRHLQHVHDPRSHDPSRDSRGVRPEPARHHQGTGAALPDLSPHRVGRPLRPLGRDREDRRRIPYVLHVGAHGSHRRPAHRRGRLAHVSASPLTFTWTH